MIVSICHDDKSHGASHFVCFLRRLLGLWLKCSLVSGGAVPTVEAVLVIIGHVPRIDWQRLAPLQVGCAA